MSEECSIFSVNGVQNLFLTSGVQTSQAPRETIYICKTVFSSRGIFVAIAKIILYGSKLLRLFNARNH